MGSFAQGRRIHFAACLDGGCGANFKVSFLFGQLRLHSVALMCQMGEGGCVDVV